MGSDVEVNVTAKPETGEKHLFHEIVIFMDHVVIHPSAIIISSIGIFRKNDDCVSKTQVNAPKRPCIALSDRKL